MLEENDSRETYCRLLGHYLRFKYCRSVKNGLPCAKILDCWFETFLVKKFIEKHFSKNELETIFIPPKPKISSLLEAIEKAKKGKRR